MAAAGHRHGARAVNRRDFMAGALATASAPALADDGRVEIVLHLTEAEKTHILQAAYASGQTVDEFVADALWWAIYRGYAHEH